MTVFFILWVFFFTVINNSQRFFNNLFFKYNKTNLFYKTKYNNLAFFEMFFLSFFFNIKNFKTPFFKSIYFFRKNNFPLFFFYHSLKNKNVKKFVNNSIKLHRFYKQIIFTDLNNLTFTLNNFYTIESNFFFYKTHKNNFKKLNFIFTYYFNFNFSKKYKLYNFYNFYNFYNYYNNFYTTQLKEFKKNFDFFKKINKSYNFYFKNLFFSNQNYLFFNFNIVKTIQSNYKINNYISNISKLLNLKNINKYNIMYLRKNKIFNKGRYSRNRQLYRTGVYWCLWLNIILVYGLYFIFYRFSFNFGYIWWGCLILLYSTIFSRILKYNFFNIRCIKKEFFYMFIWFSFILKNFIIIFSQKINFFISKLSIYKNINNFFNFNYLNFNFLINIYNYFYNYNKLIYFYNYNKINNSFLLNYKFILNWFLFVIKTLFK